MKKSINFNLKKLLFLPLIVLMTFTSCQDEVVDVTEPNDQETLVANSALANFIQSTTTLDGSFDNIIDNANCISINLPVTIIVNGIEITIDTEEDLAVIEAIFDQFSDDVDEVDIVFPIIIILNDYTEATINNLEELIAFAEECAGEDEDDNDIECIDFQYPISISIYDSNFQVIDTEEINGDEELYDFIEDLEGGVLASINFPVNMILADGTIVEVNNNTELEAAIEAAEDACDEDDDNDYDDDDNNDVPVDDLNILCSNCTWSVARLEIDNEDIEDQYVGYVFTFVPEGPAYVEAPDGTVYEGTWGLTENDNGIPALSINIPDLPDVNNELWLLNEIIENGDDVYVDFRNGEDRIKFERLECDDEEEGCSEENVDAYFAECHWIGDINSTADFNDYDFYFKADQVLKAYDTVNSTEIFGTWMTSENNDGDVIVTIEMPAPLQDFNGEWTVIECDEERIKIIKGDDYIVYERECEDDSCTEEQVDSYLVECVWNAVNYNGIDDFSDWDLEFNADGTFTITNVNGPITANWSTSGGTNGVIIDFSDIEGNSDLQGMNGSWLVIQCADDRIKVENDNGDYIIFEQDCENSDPCTEADVDAYVLECIWSTVSLNGSDDLIIFDMDFNADGTLTITGDGQTIDANWSTSTTADGVWVEFSNVNAGNIQAITGNWLITECAEDRFKMFNDNQDYIVLERDCN